MIIRVVSESFNFHISVVKTLRRAELNVHQ